MKRLQNVAMVIVLTVVMCFSVAAWAAAQEAQTVLQEDFEKQIPADWSVVGSSVAVSSEQAHSGGYSLRVRDGSRRQGAGVRTRHIPVQSGFIYTATAWAKTESGAVQLHLQFFDEEGKQVGGNMHGLNSAGDWSLLSTSLEAPKEAKTAQAVFWGHIKNIGTAFYDDLTITEQVTTAVGLNRSAADTLVADEQLPTGSTGNKVVQEKEFVAQVIEHPRLVFASTDVAEWRQRLQDSYGPNYKIFMPTILGAANTKRFATSFSAGGQSFPLPPQLPEGADVPWQSMTMGIRTHLVTLARAYALSGDERYASVAKRDLLAMTEWESWAGPGDHSADYGTEAFNTTYLTEGVAQAYDMLYAYLTPEERSKVRQALLEKALRPLYSYAKNKLIDHNKYIIRIAALGFGALALLDEEPQMEEYIRQAYERTLWYLDQRENSRQIEGMNYLSVSMGHLTYFMDALDRVVGDRSLFDHPYMQETLPRFVAYFSAPARSGLVNFGDAELSTNYLSSALSAIAFKNGNAFANWFAFSVAGSTVDPPLPALPDSVVKRPPDEATTSAVFPKIGWAALRSGWEDDDTLLALVSSGSTRSHSHFDQNHFVLNVAGDWLIKDPGYKDRTPGPGYDFSYGSLGHNTVLINGETQTTAGSGRIVHSFLSSSLDYVAGDGSNAYAGTSLQEWMRHVIYVKPDYFVLLDEMLVKDAGDRPEILLHQNGSVLVSGEAVEPGRTEVVSKFAIQNKERANVQAVWPKAMQIKFDVAPGAEKYGPFVSLLPKIDSRRKDVVTLIDPIQGTEVDAEITDVDADATHVRFTVVKGGRKDLLWVGLSSRTQVAATSLEGAGLTTDGRHGVIRLTADGQLSGYTMLAGENLALDQQLLLQSDVEISTSVQFSESGSWQAEITAEKAGTVQIWVPSLNSTVKLDVKAGSNTYAN